MPETSHDGSAAKPASSLAVKLTTASAEEDADDDREHEQEEGHDQTQHIARRACDDDRRPRLWWLGHRHTLGAAWASPGDTHMA